MQHKKFIELALREAKKNQGLTFPNPSVAAILVKDDLIIDKAVTAKGGNPHAEKILLKRHKKKDLVDSILYVTLEPCSHYGKSYAL